MIQKVTLKPYLGDLPQKLAGKNKRALTICNRLLREAPNYDRRSKEGYQTLLTLADEHISGKEICTLYENVCGRSIKKMIKLLRAREAGIIDAMPFHNAIKGKGDKKLDVNSIVNEVEDYVKPGTFYFSYQEGRQISGPM